MAPPRRATRASSAYSSVAGQKYPDWADVAPHGFSRAALRDLPGQASVRPLRRAERTQTGTTNKAALNPTAGSTFIAGERSGVCGSEPRPGSDAAHAGLLAVRGVEVPRVEVSEAQAERKRLHKVGATVRYFHHSASERAYAIEHPNQEADAVDYNPAVGRVVKELAPLPDPTAVVDHLLDSGELPAKPGLGELPLRRAVPRARRADTTLPSALSARVAGGGAEERTVRTARGPASSPRGALGSTIGADGCDAEALSGLTRKKPRPHSARLGRRPHFPDAPVPNTRRGHTTYPQTLHLTQHGSHSAGHVTSAERFMSRSRGLHTAWQHDERAFAAATYVRKLQRKREAESRVLGAVARRDGRDALYADARACSRALLRASYYAAAEDLERHRSRDMSSRKGGMGTPAREAAAWTPPQADGGEGAPQMP